MIGLLLLASASAFAQAPRTGRPILFVHGWCADPKDWDVLAAGVQSSILLPALYPDPKIYHVYYDGESVKSWPDGQDFLTTTPQTARIFSIVFFDGLASSQDGNGNFAKPNTIQVA